jgi:hypothetical protein
MALSDNSKKIILWSTIVAVLGVGGYYGYKFLKKRKEEAEAKRKQEEADRLASENKPNVNPANPNNGSSVNQDSPADAPFTTPEDIKAFQKWVYDVKNDKSLATTKYPNGQDGLWGKKCTTAWAKYSVEYTKAKGLDSSVTDAELEVAKTILLNLWQGDKATFKNRLETSNRNFVKLWSKEITTNNGMGTNKSNAFIFANQLYSIAEGKRIYNSNPIKKYSKPYGALDQIYFRRTPSRTAQGFNLFRQEGKEYGKVTWYVWNQKEGILFFFIPTDVDGNKNDNPYTASFNVKFK